MHTKKPEGTYPPGSPPPINFHGIPGCYYPLRLFMQLSSRDHQYKHHTLATSPIIAMLTGFSPHALRLSSPHYKANYSTAPLQTYEKGWIKDEQIIIFAFGSAKKIITICSSFANLV